jgi:hypothetical protein
MMAMETYKEAHRNVLKIEKELSALREERTNLSEDDPRAYKKAQKRIFSKQTALVTRWGNASQKRNKELSALETILREYAVLESK